MEKLQVLNTKGEKVSDIKLNKEIWGIEPNDAVLYDALRLARNNFRQGTADTKTRSEVSGGGRKPWRQKGTGRARQGSIRAPQWRGGGTVFGPTPRKYGFKLNKKVARLALRSALSCKVADNEFVVLDKIGFAAPKTKDMIKVLENLNVKGKTLLVMDEIDENVRLSARNIPGVMVLDSHGINVYDILNSNNMIVTEAAVRVIEEGLA